MDVNKMNSQSCDDVRASLDYIGVDLSDFALCNSMFARPCHHPIHGIGHIYRTMIACALLGKLLQRPREALLAFCGAYIHDLARVTDDIESEHGENAALKYFDRFAHIWDRYQLTTEEREQIKQAVIQHSVREWLCYGDKGYDVMVQLSVLPLIGIIAWKSAFLPSLQLDIAESPSTMYISRMEGSFERQGTNFSTLLETSIVPVSFFFMSILAFSAFSRLRLFTST